MRCLLGIFWSLGVAATSPFITTWRTNSSNENITFPLITPLTSNLTVDWGDSAIVNISALPVTHTYAAPGLYNVSIVGDIYGFRFNGAGDKLKLLDVVSWGDSFFVDSSSTYAFNGCSNLRVSAPANTQPVFLTNATLKGMFMYSGINSPLNWNLANVTSLAAMFLFASAFNQPLTFSNSQGVTDTSSMFNGATKFNSPLNLDTTNVINMANMFNFAPSFNQPVNFSNTMKVSSMDGMFSGASSFNQAIDFQANSLRSTVGMFAGAVSFNKPVVLRNTALLTSTESMFANATSFNSVVNMSSTANVTNMNSMFSKVTGFDQSLAHWNTSAVINCSSFCEYCGLPSFLDCHPCSSGLPPRVSPSRGLVCNCPAVEPNCVPSFITTWRTNSSNESITFPLITPLTSNLTVDWGDGFVVNISALPVTHTYAAPGLYNVSIVGDIYGLSFNSEGDRLKLLDVVSWGASFFMDSTSANVFSGCSNLRVSAPANTQPVFLLGATLTGMFANSGINSPLNWNLANVTSLAGMFEYASAFNQPLTFSNSQGVTETSYMFYEATNFNSPLNLDTANVITMAYMFQAAGSFNQPINFDTGNVQSMNNMFYNAISFNQSINFNTSSLTQAICMFTSALAFNSPVTFASTLLLTATAYMFYYATSFNQPITFQTDNVTDMNSMFAFATSFNQPLGSNFNTGKVQTATCMFQEASSFNQPINFDTSKLQSADYMFQSATAFNSAVNFTSLLLLASVQGLFAGATSFNQPLHFNTSNSLMNVSSMLSGATSFNSVVDFTTTRGVTNFGSMFMDAVSFNQPVNFQTDSAVDMHQMFAGATNFNQPVNFNTSNVASMDGMFFGASSFNQAIDFRADKLLSTANMFANAVSFNKPVELRNTNLLTSTARMFANAASFNSTITLSSTASVTNMDFMFSNVSGGFDQSLANWSTDAVINCSSFCDYCGLPSFPRCIPCGASARRVIPGKGSVCKCPAPEPNCEADLCKLFKVGGSLEVACLAPTPTPAGSPGVAPSSSSKNSKVVIISPLFNITHGDDHGNGSSSFVFTLPLDPQAYTELGKVAYAQSCGTLELSCEWQDPESLEFRQSGCAVTKSMVDMGSGIVGTECTCSHLTVFAIALRTERQLAPLCHASEVDYVLLGLHSVLIVCLLAQLARLVYYKLYTQSTASTLQHCLLLLACVLRVVFIIAKPVVESLAGLVMLGLLPSAISLILFIYLMLTWTSLQFVTFSAAPFDRFRVPFIVVAIAVLVLITALVIAVAATPKDGADEHSAATSQSDVVVSGSYVLAALYAVVCALVLVAGLSFRRTLSAHSTNSAGSSTSSSSIPATALNWRAVFRCRVLLATLGLSSCLLLSACLWVAAVQADIIVSDANTLGTTAAFYVSDWLSLCVLTWLLSSAIRAAAKKQNSKHSSRRERGSSHGSEHGSEHTTNSKLARRSDNMEIDLSVRHSP